MTELAEKKPERLLSLDAFRGAIMLMMVSAGLGISQLAKAHPNSAVWQFFGYHTDHAEWAGCAVWDIIQPAFMFMVGVALPWSIANRRARGESFNRMLFHAILRAVILVLLAVFLSSTSAKRTDWTFPNVLAQIGLGYPILFLLAFAKPRVQWIAAFGILFAYWLAFALHPLPPADFKWASVGVPDNWPHFTGFAAHWDKNYNFAATFDQWFLNLFPRDKPFDFNRGGYQTLNFVPSIATMLFGTLAGQTLRAELPMEKKLQRLLLAGVAGIVLGEALSLAGLVPIVKRIWTPSWALFSSGVVSIILAGFVAVIDWRSWKRWTFPLVVAGLNPITLYVLWQLSAGFFRESIKIHFGQKIFESFGETYVQSLQRLAVMVVIWLILLWMYRNKIFLRI